MVKKTKKEQTDQALETAQVPMDSFIGQAAYIKGSEGTQFSTDTEEVPNTPRAPAPAEPQDLSLKGKQPGDIADKQILIRVTQSDRERWQEAAKIDGKSLSEFIRDLINEKVRGMLECNHPLDRRKTYPWSSFCLVCGKRIK